MDPIWDLESLLRAANRVKGAALDCHLRVTVVGLHAGKPLNRGQAEQGWAKRGILECRCFVPFREWWRMKFQHTPPIFDYRALRLMLGIIAFALPWLVTAIAQSSLPSISASYFTEARDEFVGLLFVVGGLMLAYNGHTRPEAWAAKTAAISALLIALFPTAKACGESSTSSMIHGAAAVLLLVILAWFCFVPFRKNTKGQGGKAARRAKLYFLCGSVLLAALAAGLIGKLALSCQQVESIDLIYWVEAVALTAFGVAWITAGKIIPVLVDEKDALKLFRN